MRECVAPANPRPKDVPELQEPELEGQKNRGVNFIDGLKKVHALAVIVVGIIMIAIIIVAILYVTI